MRIIIKNMVSTRCKMVVEAAFEKLDIHYKSLELGEVETSEHVSVERLNLLDSYLRQSGLELYENRKHLLVEKIKTYILELANYSGEPEKILISDYLRQRLHYDYSYLSNLFSEINGISIGKFFIKCKIDHVIKLIINDELNLKEISYLTKYSSVAHLTNQFKKVTGLNPSQFRQLQQLKHASQEMAVS